MNRGWKSILKQGWNGVKPGLFRSRPMAFIPRAENMYVEQLYVQGSIRRKDSIDVAYAVVFSSRICA